MTACLLAGTQFFFVLGSIWKTWALVVKMGCSLEQGQKKWMHEAAEGEICQQPSLDQAHVKHRAESTWQSLK